jgi:peptidoglycan/LPS O-acetylase OafA/YrhL
MRAGHLPRKAGLNGATVVVLNKSQPAELAQLTGLRGLAALLVLFGHLKTPEGMTLDFGIFDPFSRFGGFGVDVFFVLSGFILCHVYADRLLADRGVLREFFVARFARIYPLHVLTLVLMLGAHLVSLRAGVTPTEASGYTIDASLLSLLLVSEWVGAVAPNPVSWSISVEFANYLIFAVVILAMARFRRWSPFVIILCAVVLATIDDWRLARGVDEFIMGCAAFFCAREFTWRGMGWLSGPLFVAPFLLSAYGIYSQYWLVALCFAAVVFLLASGSRRDPFQRLCSSRPLVFLGDISLSVYLFQWFIWIGWKHVIAKTPPFAAHPYLMVLGAATTVIGVSVITHPAFERPTRTWLRKRLAAKPAINARETAQRPAA